MKYEDCRNSSVMGLLPTIPNPRMIEYHQPQITKEMHKVEDFDESSVYSVEIYKVDSQAKMNTLMKFAQTCVNLETLKINMISTRAGLNVEKMKTYFTPLQNLKELHLGSYSNRLDFTYEMFNVIKTELKNLLKLVVIVDEQKLEEMRERLKMFNDTKTRTIALRKTSLDTCLENEKKTNEILPAICVWKR